MKRRAALCCALLLASACRDDKPSAAPAPSLPDAAPASPAQPSDKTKPASSALTEAAVRGLVERWVSTQNAQDFAGYQQLYATRFTGIKRAAERVSQFDRAGWLLDRKGMFARGFTLAADDVQVRVLGASAQVAFQQTFRSPSFSDQGPKQLIVVAEQGQPRIAREEMLSSQLQDKLAEGAVDDAAFAFVRTIEGRVFWLSNRSAADLTVEGEPQLLAVGAAFAALAGGNAPAPLQGVASKQLTVHTLTGKTCDIKLERWGVLAHFEPHFGDRARWSGQDEAVKLSTADIAREVFGPSKVSGQAHKIAVDITEQTKACPGAVWARDKALTPLSVLAVRKIEAADLTALTERVHATAPYKQAQKDHVAEGGKGPWETLGGAVSTAVMTTLGAVEHQYSNQFFYGDCSGFNANVSTLFRVEGGRARVQPASVGEQTGAPLLATDLNGDGVPEWIFPARVIGWNGKRYQVTLDAQPPSFDCPC